jgi:hypothetical protein
MMSHNRGSQSSALQLFLSGSVLGFLLGALLLLLVTPTTGKRIRTWVKTVWLADISQHTSVCTAGTNTQRIVENTDTPPAVWLDDPYETEVGY